MAEELDDELAPYSARVHRVPQHPLHFYLDGRNVRKELARLAREGPIDAVLGHVHEAGGLPAFCRRSGARLGYLATWQTYSYLGQNHPGLGWWFRQRMDRRYIVEAHRQAEVVFALSEFTRGELVEYMGLDPDRIVICPLGVDPHFTSIRREPRDQVKHLLFFGRIVALKGFVDALRALGELKRRGVTDWTYRFVGFGHYAKVKEIAAEEGIADQVEIHPPTDDVGLAEHLAWADLALMPSHFESFGLSIAEAQGAGLPVVAYAVGSVPEVVANGDSGWLVPFREITSLTDRVEAAIADPAGTRAAGECGRARVRELFHWARTARILLDGFGVEARAQSPV
jgi:glycosyltransferase involved in cell wall biosynthesis